jgi:hypothetical protein
MTAASGNMVIPSSEFPYVLLNDGRRRVFRT